MAEIIISGSGDTLETVVETTPAVEFIVEGALAGAKGDMGGGVATGGTKGQLLTKRGSTDGDTAWADASYYNVKMYGATGDGTTNDTAAVQAAIDAVPTTGGTVFFPSGTYVITSALNMKTGLKILGDGPNAATIKQNSTTANALQGTELTRVSIENIKVSGPASGSGIGISFATSTTTNNYISIRNVRVLNFGGDGIYLARSIVSAFEVVTSQGNGGHAFNIDDGTSFSAIACYALSAQQAGWRLNSMQYSTLNGCASDSCGIGYLIDTGEAVNLIACGCESTVNRSVSYPGTGFKITAGHTVGLYNCTNFANLNIALLVTGSATLVSVLNFFENSPTGTATASIQFDSGSTGYVQGVQVTTATSYSDRVTSVVPRSRSDFNIKGNAVGIKVTQLDGSGTNTNPGNQVQGVDANNRAFGALVVNDTNNRWVVNADGKQEWGSGAASRDTNLYRSAVDTLKTDDSLIVTGTLIGPVQDKGGQVFNVKSYGALGDDSTDDYAAIAATIAACPEGGIVYFPAGIYRVSQTVQLTRNRTYQGSHSPRWSYRGGVTCAIKPHSTFASASIIQVPDKEITSSASDNDGGRIRNIAIDGNSKGTTVIGLEFKGLVRDWHVQDVDISQTSGNAFQTTLYTRADTSANYPRGLSCINVTSYSSGLSASGTGIGFSLTNTTDSTFDNCLAVSSEAQGWLINNPGETKFVSCRAVFCVSDGFRITGSATVGGAQFIGCSTDRNGKHGVQVTATGTQPIQFVGHLSRRDGSSATGNLAGIAIVGSGGNTVVPVTIMGLDQTVGVDDGGGGTASPAYGVYATYAQRVTVSGTAWGVTNGIKDAGNNTLLSVRNVFQRSTTSGTIDTSPVTSTDALAVRDTDLIIQDDGDLTKQVQFQASGITTGTTRTLTVPDASGTIALLASPALTGTPTAPTASANTNTTQLATTAYVDRLGPVGVGTTGFRDDFLGTSSNAAITTATSFPTDSGTWAVVQVSGGTQSITPQAATFANPGVLKLLTTAVSGQGVAMSKSGSGVASFGALGSNAGWEANFILALGQTTSTSLRFGFVAAAGQASDAPSSWFGVEYDTANTGNTDTKFTWVTRQAGSPTYTTTNAINADTSNHHFRIRSTAAGTILFSVDGGTETAVSATVSTVAMMMFVQIISRTTATTNVLLDYVGYVAATGRT